MKKHNLYICVNVSILIALLTISAFFRFYQLDQQGLIFFDSARFTHRALQFKTIITQNLDVSINTFYGDSKILWLALLTWAQMHFPNHMTLVTGSFFSAFFGILTVGLTFLMAYQLYHSRTIAFLSAAILSVSPYHIFYSRIALPESLCAFFFLLSIYLYWIAMETKKMRWAILSAGVGGLSFLSNRFRVAMLPLSIAFIEWHKHHKKGGTYSKSLRSVLLYLGLFLITIVVVSTSIGRLFKSYGLNLPPYFQGLKAHITLHASPTWNLESFVTFPYYIIQIEGWPMALMGLTSLLFIRKSVSTLVPLSIFMLQVIPSSLVDEKVARSLSAVLPFFSILISVSLYHFFCMTKNKPVRQGLLAAFVTLMMVINLSHAIEVLSFRSDMKKALTAIDRQDQNAKIITTNPFKGLVYLSSDRILALSPENFQQLPQLYRSGVRYIVLDFLKYIPPDYQNYIDIEAQCHPMLIYPDYTQPLLKRIEIESMRPLSLKLKRQKSISEEIGQLKIYALGPCLKQFYNDKKK